jgi:excisionase family DNA binding protein
MTKLLLKMLTVPEVAARLGLQPATIRSWRLRRKHLPFVCVGRAIRVSEEAVARFIETNTVPAERR